MSLLHRFTSAISVRAFATFFPGWIAGLIFLATTSAQGQTPKAWSTGTVDGNFGGTNWTLGVTPAAAGTTSAVTGDLLYFGTSATTTLNNDLAGATFSGFTFNSGASAYTIGGNSFTLAGGISNNSVNLQTIGNGITLAATQTITTNTGDLRLTGVIDGSGFGMTKAGSGTLTLTNANTYTGATTVTSGTLALNFGFAGTPANNIVSSASALILGGGTLQIAGASGGSNTQTFSGTTFNPGGSAVTLVPNGAVVFSAGT